MNLLRQVRTNNKLSAYEILEGGFNFDKTPLAPPGTKALVFDNPDTRMSWAPRTKDAWFVGPALKNYRCFKFFVTSTKVFTIGQTAILFQVFPKCPHYQIKNAQY